MKTIILFVLSVATLTKAGPPGFFQHISECKGSASDADIAAIMSHQVPLPANAYCVLGCAMKKAGMMNADNSLNIEKIKSIFTRLQQRDEQAYQNLVGVFEGCKPAGSLSECDAAKSIYECSEPKIKQIMPMPPGGPH